MVWKTGSFCERWLISQAKLIFCFKSLIVKWVRCKFLSLPLFSLLRTDRCLERKRSWRTSVWLYIVCWFQEDFDRCDSHTSNIYRSCLVLLTLTTCTSAAHVTYQSRNQFEFHTVVRVCFVFRPAVLLPAVVTDLD